MQVKQGYGVTADCQLHHELALLLGVVGSGRASGQVMAIAAKLCIDCLDLPEGGYFEETDQVCQG